MNYRQIVEKMTPAMKNNLTQQDWVKPYAEAGMELPHLFASEEVLQKLRKRLTETESTILHTIVISIGTEPFSIEELERSGSSGLSGAEIKVGLAGLRRTGTICTFRKSWGEQLYYLPEEGFRAWQAVMLPRFVADVNCAENDEHLLICKRGVTEDLFRLLIIAANGELNLTKKNMLQKKQLRKLSTVLTLKSECYRNAGLEYAFSDFYEPATAVTIELCIRLGLLKQQQEKWSLNREAVGSWLHQTAEEQLRHVYKLWKQLTGSLSVWLQHALCALEIVPKGRWVSLQALMEWLVSCEISLCGLGLEEGREQLTQRLEALCSLGLLEIDMDNEQRPVRWLVELNPHGGRFIIDERNKRFYVQPDFELLVPPTVPFYVEWEIAQFAGLVSKDPVAVYRMTKESVQAAFEGGRTAAEIISFLTNHAIFDISEQVLFTLRQWGEQYGRVQFAQVTLLRCQSANWADEIERDGRCIPFLENRIGEQAESEDEKQTYFSFLQAPPSDFKEVEQGTNESSAVHLLYASDKVSHLELEQSLPQLEEIYPNMKEIPASWLKECRNYHDSTRKDIVRKAIEWQSYLRLRQEGREITVAPKSLFEERSGWKLVGFAETREIRLALKEWDEMRLILPGINDK